MTPTRDALRSALTEARRAGDRDLAAALRTTLAALDNAEAVPGAPAETSAASAHVAGGRAGLGAAEASRRVLAQDEERAIVRAEVEDLRAAAAEYSAAGHDERAASAARTAGVLEGLP
ncbi:MAG TPA: hypothetical protein VFJ28_08900 [Marmoricola sp.]|nr:hypothetical protein [Marmoricola sp.]